MIKKFISKIKEWFAKRDEILEIYMSKSEEETKHFTVVIEETLVRTVDVLAATPDKAFREVWEDYCDGNIRLSKGDFNKVNITVDGEDKVNFYEK